MPFEFNPKPGVILLCLDFTAGSVECGRIRRYTRIHKGFPPRMLNEAEMPINTGIQMVPPHDLERYRKYGAT